MDQVGLIVLGAVVGAFATGGVSLYSEARRERLARRVAARVIVGDLKTAQLMAFLATHYGGWNQMDWSGALESWPKHREALAASLTAPEWTLVDNAFRALAEIGVPGQAEPLSQAARAKLARYETAASKAERVVIARAVRRREREAFEIGLESWYAALAREHKAALRRG